MDLNSILTQVNDTDELIIGSGSISRSHELIKKYWPGKTAMIIADTNTWTKAGRLLKAVLEENCIKSAEPLIFRTPPYLHADYENVCIIIEAAKKAGDPLLIAVGSGTINDLVKRASFELGAGYLCVGTAASMDGYCSSGAALSCNGRKQTMECPAPQVIIADTDILKGAPAEMGAAGYGDLASKLTAGADWIIADTTGDDPIDETTWSIVQPRLENWLAEPGKTASGDADALAGVFEGLNFCGLAMQILGRSRAASGAEHMFSHIWEMSGHRGADGNPVSHGFQVSVGILCVSALYEEVFGMNQDDIDVDAAVSAWPSWAERSLEIKNLMGELPSWEEYLDICREKYLTRAELEDKLLKLKKNWSELKHRVGERLPSYGILKKMMTEAGCPVTPEEINLSRETAVSTYQKAQCMRNRYTVLDLAYELGVFSKYINNIADSTIYLR